MSTKVFFETGILREYHRLVNWDKKKIVSFLLQVLHETYSNQHGRV